MDLPPEEETGVDVAAVAEEVPPPPSSPTSLAPTPDARGEGQDGGKNPTSLPPEEERRVVLVAGGGSAAVAAAGRGGRGAADTDGDARRGGGDDGQVGGDGGGGDAGDDRQAQQRSRFASSIRYFDEQKCSDLVAAKRWALLDTYLCNFLRSIGEIPENHPILLLPVRRELVMRTLRYISVEAAVGMFTSVITPLRQDTGMFVPLSGYLMREVNLIEKKLKDNDWRTDWPGDESFVEEILDYIRLYFPLNIRHNQLTDGRIQDLWNLTMILRNGEGVPIKSKKKTHYRCLACGWKGGSKSGIAAQESHLTGDKGRGNASCEMTTPRIYRLLRVRLPERRAEPRTMLGAGQKRKRQPPRTRQVQIPDHLGQSTSNHVAPNTDPLPLDAVAGLSEEVPAQVRELNQDPLPLDVVAGLSEEVPVQAQELNLHGALAGLPQEVPEHLGFVIQAPELQPGYMDVAVVLDSRRSINILVNALVRLLPVLEFVTPARGALHAILECCQVSMAPGLFRGMVYAPAVLQALWAIKEALSALENQLLIVGQEAMNLFTSIDWHVNALEQLCLHAMPPVLGVGHGQHHGQPVAPAPPQGHGQHHGQPVAPAPPQGHGQHHGQPVAPAPPQGMQVHDQPAPAYDGDAQMMQEVAALLAQIP